MEEATRHRRGALSVVARPDRGPVGWPRLSACDTTHGPSAVTDADSPCLRVRARERPASVIASLHIRNPPMASWRVPALARWSVVILATALACADGPTAPAAPTCQSVSVGASLSASAPSALVLLPMLDDARTRVIPSLSTATPAISSAVLELQGELASGGAVTACDAYNIAATAFNAIAATAPPEDTPDLEALRLALQIARLRVSAN